MRRSTRVSRGDSGDAVSVSQERDDAFAEVSDLISLVARKREAFTMEMLPNK